MNYLKKALPIAIPLLIAAILAGVVISNGGPVNLLRNMLGLSSDVQEDETINWAAATEAPILVPEGTDTTAKYTNVVSNGSLYAVYNGIWSRDTGYFMVPGGSLTITACGTAEGTQRYKIAVWKKVDSGAEYVSGSTGYIKTDGANYRYTVTGLDPNARYRITVSYDSSRYYLYGMFQAEGVAV